RSRKTQCPARSASRSGALPRPSLRGRCRRRGEAAVCGSPLINPHPNSSWPGLTRPSTSCLNEAQKTWMPGTSPGMTETVNRARSAKTPRGDWQGASGGRQIPPIKPALKTDIMTAAILLAFASATFLGAGVVTAQLGLRTVEPLSGAAISVPSFTLLFLLFSPLILQDEPVVWRGLPIFIAIGLFFPASLTLLTFASNRALGPVITSTLGNLAPLFAVATAVIL